MLTGKFSPVEIETVLQVYYLGRPNDETPAIQSAMRALLNHGLIAECASLPRDPQTFALTQRGEVFVQSILDTPLPVQQWVDPRKVKTS